MKNEIYLSSSSTIPFKIIATVFFPSLFFIIGPLLSPEKISFSSWIGHVTGYCLMASLILFLMRNTVSVKVIGEKIYFARWKKNIEFNRTDINTVSVNSYLNSYIITMKNGERYHFSIFLKNPTNLNVTKNMKQ
jgi:hypothetical protein